MPPKSLRPLPSRADHNANRFSGRRQKRLPRWFFKMSRSIFTRDNSDRRRLIPIFPALTAGVAELFNPPLPADLTQLCSVSTPTGQDSWRHPLTTGDQAIFLEFQRAVLISSL